MTLLAPGVRRAEPVTRTTPALVAVSHGTSCPIGQASVAALVTAVEHARADLHVAGGFVDVQQPDVPATLGSVESGRPAVVVPLLLSAGFHVHVDLVEDLEATERSTALGRAMGPDDRLVAVLARRLEALRVTPDDRIVLAAAGSTDARAVADCFEMGRRLEARLRVPVVTAFVSAASPAVPEAVADTRASRPRGRVVIATYLLAPGYFARLLEEAGADAVTSPLLHPGEAPDAGIVDLVIDRYEEASAGLSD
ncbi:cobalamin biosynthesis protein CbiX [Plantibacter sp. VKM Ac-2880]|uniref:sirohydrochlorin chelatase n=1 Tax=Plantibacter sp. VKM Ac-2880 TaxID=2783827 RepID=UPI001890A382|nr:CbiX/SirB N-terminal domain-containing protein [Plantibacter sp. VKM Ac-2880]MBF4568881.1 cobalamin biosynthesis protein CbiX [Plantibacter sp. VKM Ac-2880]